MSALGRLASFFGFSAGERRSSPRAAVQEASGGRTITTSQELEEYLREGSSTGSGMSVTPDSAMRVAAVFRCVTLISGAVATMPLNVLRRINARTREDASDHPLWAVLRRRPNAWMTPSAFRRLLTAWVLLRGNGYALKVRSMGRLIALLPMHPDRVQVDQLDDMSLVYTYTRKDGRQVVLPQSDVFHLMGLSLDGVTGVSVIRYAAEAIGLARAAETHGAAFFANGTNVGAVLKAKKELGEEAQATLRASLEAYRGAANANKVLILEEDMDYGRTDMTAEDAQLIETRKFSRTDIAMFFGVPPHMIGDTEKSTSWGTGLEQQSQGFVAYTLQDWLTAWQETIARDLIDPAEPALYAKFNTGGLIRGDIATRFAAYAVARNWGWYSVNDILELEDRNPIGPDGDTYLQPLNMTEVGAAADQVPTDALKALTDLIKAREAKEAP